MHRPRNRGIGLLLAMVVASPAAAQPPVGSADWLASTSFEPVIVAGAATGSPPDSPADRVDPNVLTSEWAGVGSVFLSTDGSTGFLCTGTPITRNHVLTAAHCADTDDDGTPDFTAGQITYFLNADGDFSSVLAAAERVLHPDFTGFNNPNTNDDLMLVTLAAPIPDAVPVYSLHREVVAAGTTFSMVGYGRSGDGINGYTVDPTLTVKRVGRNNADFFLGNDEPGGGNERFLFDFDGPSGSGDIGGPTLGNTVETNIGPGDSGGPSFVPDGGGWSLAAINTFTVSPSTGVFGSISGGVLVHPYLGWLDLQVADFDDSGAVDAGDIDWLFGEVAAGSPDRFANLNTDAVVDQADADELVRVILGTEYGDADLSGGVDFSDFLALQAAFGGAGGWADGDFNGSGAVDFSDFLLLQANFGFGAGLSPAAYAEQAAALDAFAAAYRASVPEPATGLALAAAAAAWLPRRRR